MFFFFCFFLFFIFLSTISFLIRKMKINTDIKWGEREATNDAETLEHLLIQYTKKATAMSSESDRLYVSSYVVSQWTLSHLLYDTFVHMMRWPTIAATTMFAFKKVVVSYLLSERKRRRKKTDRCKLKSSLEAFDERVRRNEMTIITRTLTEAASKTSNTTHYNVWKSDQEAKMKWNYWTCWILMTERSTDRSHTHTLNAVAFLDIHARSVTRISPCRGSNVKTSYGCPIA